MRGSFSAHECQKGSRSRINLCGRYCHAFAQAAITRRLSPAPGEVLLHEKGILAALTERLTMQQEAWATET